jgi:hypothetical protein
VTTVTDWTAGFITGLTAGMARFFGAIPNIIGAILILIIGWIVAGIVAALVTRFCRAIHVDTVADRVGVNGFLQQSGTSIRASGILGEIVKWVIRLVFIEMAADQLGMPQVTQVINQILGFIPNIIVAVIILGVGAFVGQLLGGIVRGSAREARIGNADLLARLTQGAVIAFAIIAALNQLNVAPVVVNTLYIGLVGAVALALGLAFGLGGRDTAARLTERWSGRVETATRQLQATSASAATESGTVPTVRGDVAAPRVTTPGTVDLERD